MVEFYVEPNTTTIPLGRQGENLARTIYFELSELISNYGEGTATLVYLRSKDSAPYVCDTTQSGNMLSWTPTDTDTAYAGAGKCELRWVVGETLAKSIIYTTTIAPSITGAEGVPDPYKSWYDAIIAYIEANYAANGAPQEVREAIYTLLSKAAYTETGLTDELAIVQAWTAETISVTNNLTHVTNSNTATMAEQGGSYTGTLTADSGYTLGTVTVTMGGEDVTATVYSSGTITIPSVTGDIVITATAVPAVASLSAVYTQSGTVYDTDALDTLKADLVVTATYSDSTTATISSDDYTLSGTLEAGTSTITVTYGGATATFNVTVTARTLLYHWDFTGNSPLIDKISSKVATESGTVNYDSSGMSFGTSASYIDLRLTMSAIINHEVYIEFGDMVDTSFSGHQRLFTAANQYGFICRSNDSKWNIYGNKDSSNTWQPSTLSRNSIANKTIKLVFNSYTDIDIYSDDELILENASMSGASGYAIKLGATANSSVITKVKSIKIF